MAGPIIPLKPDACRLLIDSYHWQSRVTVRPGNCWVMCGYSSPQGYPRVRLAGRLVLAHRVALVASLGRDIMSGLTVGHICHDRAHAAGLCVATDAAPCAHRRCVNPHHLAEMTVRENNLRGGTLSADCAARMVCPRGHSIDADDPDVSLRADSWARGWRQCNICNLERARACSAAIAAASKGLGLTQRQYIATFGRGRRVARVVFAMLAAGVPAQAIIDSARAGAAEAA